VADMMIVRIIFHGLKLLQIYTFLDIFSHFSAIYIAHAMFLLIFYLTLQLLHGLNNKSTIQ